MNLSDMRFPRQLEADYETEAIRRVLMRRRVKLWAEGDVDVPLINMSQTLEKTLQEAVLKGQIRCGFETISHKLASEKTGIANVREGMEDLYGERVSRLILLSNDGAQRLYRHTERLLQLHAPRLLGCLLNIDSLMLGKIITGQEKHIKVAMGEHKDAVAGILRAIIEE